MTMPRQIVLVEHRVKLGAFTQDLRHKNDSSHFITHP